VCVCELFMLCATHRPCGECSTLKHSSKNNPLCFH